MLHQSQGRLHQDDHGDDNVSDYWMVAAVFVGAGEGDAQAKTSDCEDDGEYLEWRVDPRDGLTAGWGVDEESTEGHQDDEDGGHDGAMGLTDVRLGGRLASSLGEGGGRSCTQRLSQCCLERRKQGRTVSVSLRHSDMNRQRLSGNAMLPA